MPPAKATAHWLDDQAKLDTLLEAWLQAWINSHRRSIWPRDVCDIMRSQGYNIRDIQEQISLAMVTQPAKRTVGQAKLMSLYQSILAEKEQALAEDLSVTSTGQIFLLKAQHGYEDRSTVKVEGEGLAEIIASKTKHKAEP